MKMAKKKNQKEFDDAVTLLDQAIGEETDAREGTPFYPNPESEDQWFCSIPMTDDEWKLLKKSGWRFCWDEMPDEQPDKEHPYYWFSTSSKHFITSPMAQRGKEGRIIDMIAHPPAVDWIEDLKIVQRNLHAPDVAEAYINKILDAVKEGMK